MVEYLFYPEFWWTHKKSFASDIEDFWEKIHERLNVKNCKLFEGVSPSFCNLVKRFMNPKNAHEASKMDFLQNPHLLTIS